MTRRIEVEAAAGWLALLIMATVLLGIVGLCIWLWPHPNGIDPADVRAVCRQYANLDLSGMAALCKEAGYQQ